MPPSFATRIDAAAVLAWYDANARVLPWRVPPADRRRGVAPDPYRVWLSEIMLQQTTITAVLDYFARFTMLWPGVADLAAAPLDAILRQWAGLGYYARARNLHTCAQAVMERFDGKFPTDSDQLSTLPGIGPYTSAAIAAICADERIAVLDGNVERVLARYWAVEAPVATVKPQLRADLQRDVPARAGDFGQALMDLGATICAPRNTACMLCPLSPGCAARQANTQLKYPVKPAKAERPTRYGHAFVLRDGSADVFLRARPAKGLLGGMTEVPTSDWVAEQLEPEFPVQADWTGHGPVEHVFTHFRLVLEVWSARVDAKGIAIDGWWSAPDALADEALPSLFAKVLAQAGVPPKKTPPGRTRRKS